MLNIDLKLFKKNHEKSKNQVLYHAIKSNGLKEIENLINNFLNVRNSFVFESVEKGFIKGRYTIFGKNPDKIWEFNNNNSFLIKDNKRLKLRNKPSELIEKIIEDFKFEIPRNLPSISSLISGYFSYDSIRYIENIPNSCKDDLKIPDVRLLRPQTLIVHDNLKKKDFLHYKYFCWWKYKRL